MVAAALRRSAEGLHPFDPFRHLIQVVDLVAFAFAGELGPGARHVLHQMRRSARWGGLSAWLWGLEATALGPLGFVWLEEGRVVGNVSLRRATRPGGRMIGNVAVHPDWRGRGIARALMEAAVAEVVERGGVWVGLEVRESNAVARGLYERMGFEWVGTAVELVRPAGLPWPRGKAAPLSLRRARAVDGRALYRLAVEGIGRPHQDVLGVRRSSYQVGWEAWFSAWIEGRRDDWWVAEEEGALLGALRVGSRRSGRWHELEVLAQEERLDDAGRSLVGFGLEVLARRRSWEVEATLPEPRESLEPALTAVGFERVRRLVQMRLLLGRRAATGRI